MSLLSKEGEKLLADYRSGWKFKLYVLKNLPSLWFWGVRIKNIEEDYCSIEVPFNWRSKNPFKSIYFSALAGTAELSTGALVQCYLAGKGRYSMLVVDFKMSFIKKATTAIVFTCRDGYHLSSVVDLAEKTGEGQRFDLATIGVNKKGEEVAQATITWSIKKKPSK